MKRLAEVSFFIVLFFAICFIYKGQRRISLNNGEGWDGSYMTHLSKQIEDGVNPLVGPMPFIKRLGTPFLVGMYSRFTHAEILDSALLINLAGAFITMLLLLFWLRSFIDVFWIRGLLVLLYMMAWHAPLRASFFIPMASDAWGSAWFLGGLLLLNAIKKAHTKGNSLNLFMLVLVFSFVVAIGSFFRESNSTLAIVIFLIINPFKNIHISAGTMTLTHGVAFIKKMWKLYFVPTTIILALPLVMVVLSNVILKKYIVITGEINYNYFEQVVSFFYYKTLPQYLLGICIAYGPLIIIVPFFFKQFKLLLGERQDLMALFFLALLFGLVGGTDTERIIFTSGVPLIFILMGLAIKGTFNSPQRWWLFVLLALQTFAYRFYWTVPDVPNEIKNKPLVFFTLLGNQFQYLYLFSFLGNYLRSIILLTEYCVLYMATWYIIKNKITLKSFSLFGKALK